MKNKRKLYYMLKIFWNFFWFCFSLIKNFSQGKEIFVEKKVQKQRYKICEICPKFVTNTFLTKLKGPRCAECGCFLIYKTKFKFEKCPDDKWD